MIQPNLKESMNSIQIKQIKKKDAESILLPYHYLSDLTERFRVSQYSYGAYADGSLAAVCIFTGFPVAELFKGIWGINDFKNFDQSGFYELSRLCVHPSHQGEKGFTSWFVAKCLRKIKEDHALKKQRVKAILSYADDDYHSGVIYAACNFKYYGLTAPKYNIWVPCPESEGGKPLSLEKRQGRPETHWKQMTRGWREHLDNGGIKIMRGRKHRFLLVWDKKLPPILWKEEKWTNNKAGKIINTHPCTTQHLRESDAEMF